MRGSILTNATVHRTVAPGFDAPLGRAKAGVRFAPLYFIRSKKNKATQWVVLFFLERATGKAAQRRLRRMQQAAFKAVPRLADTNVAAGRLAQRGHSRGAREGSLYSVQSASVSASWLGSLAALSAATRTRAPKRATGTFFSLRSCPVRASARDMPKRNTILSDGVSFWSGRRGSNSLPRPWQGRALPDELRPQTQD